MLVSLQNTEPKDTTMNEVTSTFHPEIIRTASERLTASRATLRDAGMGNEDADIASVLLTAPRGSFKFTDGLNMLRRHGLISATGFNRAEVGITE